MTKKREESTSELFEEQCNQLRGKALSKSYWGRLLLVGIDPKVHKKLALYAANYGMTPTPFVSEIVTEWVAKMEKKKQESAE